MDRPEQDVDRRFKVWDAMSEFYLDKELSDRDIEWVAKVCAESPYSVSELDHIMFAEVWPAVASNLASYAGEWAGFNEAWLKQEILEKAHRTSLLPWWTNPFKAFFWNGKWSVVRARVRSKRKEL